VHENSTLNTDDETLNREKERKGLLMRRGELEAGKEKRTAMSRETAVHVGLNRGALQRGNAQPASYTKGTGGEGSKGH